MIRRPRCASYPEHIDLLLERYRQQGHELPRRWYHASYPVYDRRQFPQKKAWKWSDDSRCFLLGDFQQPPSMYCLGDRMIHADYGRDSFGVLWAGSTSDNWHGTHFGYDLKEALEWIQA